MHGVKMDEGEIALVKQALKDKDWTQLPTWKLRYVYQRFSKSTKQVQEIGQKAREELDKNEADFNKNVEHAFGIK